MDRLSGKPQAASEAKTGRDGETGATASENSKKSRDA